jgi:hypothetical protein
MAAAVRPVEAQAEVEEEIRVVAIPVVAIQVVDTLVEATLVAVIPVVVTPAAATREVAAVDLTGAGMLAVVTPRLTKSSSN